VDQPLEQLRRVVDAYRSAGGRGPATLQVHVSYAAEEAEAWAVAHDQWRNGALGAPVCWDTDSVEAFDAITQHVRPEDLRDAVLVSSDPAQHAAWLVERAALGFDAVHIHHVGEDQPEFLEVFGAKVVPELQAA
jgi:alkanesulfonate monooxygenase SsuD/methylene tetrahydromethanopterin reductase-like flavin-dependent oxidoreductase (luciferase family)